MPTIDDTTVLAFSSPTRRSFEDRLIEVINVKDFGALGNSTNGVDGADDTAAIQAAIDWTASPIRGCIYFPPGIYRVTAPLTFNDHPTGSHSIVFRGAGGLASRIMGSVDGYIIDRDNDFLYGALASDAFEHLYIYNYHTSATSGCIRWGSAIGIHVRNCSLYGANGFTCGPFAFGVSVHDCEIGNAGQGAIGTGIYVTSGGPTVISGCDIIGMDTGVYIAAAGATIICCRFEENESYGVRSIAGAVLENCTFEANDVAAYIRQGAAIRDCGALGDAFGGAAATKVGGGTSGSPIITVADASDLVVGMSVSDNTGVTSTFWAAPQGHYVVSKNTGVTPHQVTLSKNNIGTAAFPGVRKTGCTCVASSMNITVPDPSGLSVGMYAEDLEQNVLVLSGSSDTTPRTITAISGTTVTISVASFASASPVTIDFGTSFHFHTFATGGYLVEASANNVIENSVVTGYFSSFFFKAGIDTSITLRDCLAQDNIDVRDASRRLTIEAPVYLGARIRTEGCNFSYAHTFATLPTVASGTTYEDYKLPRQGEKLYISDGGAQAIGAVVTGSGDLGSTFMEVMWTGSAWRRVA